MTPQIPGTSSSRGVVSPASPLDPAETVRRLLAAQTLGGLTALA